MLKHALHMNKIEQNCANDSVSQCLMWAIISSVIKGGQSCYFLIPDEQTHDGQRMESTYKAQHKHTVSNLNALLPPLLSRIIKITHNCVSPRLLPPFSCLHVNVHFEEQTCLLSWENVDDLSTNPHAFSWVEYQRDLPGNSQQVYES